MMAIGSYFALIIFVMGTMLAAHDISEEERKQFFQEILEAHNFFRDRHNTERLKLDQEICNKMKALMETLKTNLSFTVPEEYGMNYLKIEFNDDKPLLNGHEIVSTWYKNAEGYDYFKEPPLPKDTNTFTQIVWESTRRIGVGLLIKDKKCYVVVAYSPHGNQKGQYISNVLQPHILIGTSGQ